MSGSVHINGNTRANMKSTLRQHQLRDDEKEGQKALKATESDIDPKLSHMNLNYFDDPDRFPKMRKKIDTINEKRTQDGKKKMYKSANVFMTGTLQLSNESLHRLGWKFEDEEALEDALPADKQPEHALKNVKAVYADMIQSVHKQPEVYGDVFSATLHLDESSPHVDFLSDPLDVDKPYQAARAFLNGPKGDAKRNVRRMQDNLFKHSRFDEATKKKYDLVRGEPYSKKKDKMKTIKKDEVEVKKAQKDLTKGMTAAGQALQETSKRTKELDTREKSLDERENALNERENKLSEKEEQLNEQESTLHSQKIAVNERMRVSEGNQLEADEKLSEAQNKLDNATEKEESATDKLSEAEKLNDDVIFKLAETEKRFAEIQKENKENRDILKELKRFGNRLMDTVEAIRNGDIGLRTAKRTMNNLKTPFDNQENLEQNNLVLDDLEDKQQNGFQL